VSQDNPAVLQLSLDGVPLSDLAAYRAQSPVFSYTLTTDNVISFLLAPFSGSRACRNLHARGGRRILGDVYAASSGPAHDPV
jgi:hypothetical protein